MRFNDTRWMVFAAGIFLVTAAGALAAPWKHLTEAEGLPSRQIQFIKNQGADVWVGTLQGLVVFRVGKPETVLTGEAAWDVLAVPSGAWIGTDNGIVRRKGAATERSLAGGAVGRIVPFGTNAIWAISKRPDSSTLMEYVNKKWQSVKRFEGRKPTEMFVTRSGGVWVILEANGIISAHPDQPPDQWTHHQPGVNLTSFFEDQQGRIWCGSWDRGILMFDQGQWKRLLTEEDAVLTAVRQDGKGHIWVATNAHGVWEYDGAQWINHLTEEGTINLLETTNDGRVLVSSQSVCSLRQWNGKTWDTILDLPTMTLGVVTDSQGKIWAANTLDGLYVEP